MTSELDKNEHGLGNPLMTKFVKQVDDCNKEKANDSVLCNDLEKNEHDLINNLKLDEFFHRRMLDYKIAVLQ